MGLSHACVSTIVTQHAMRCFFSRKNIKTTIAIIIGIILGPLFYLSIPEWSILIAGFIGGTTAFLMKGKNNDI